MKRFEDILEESSKLLKEDIAYFNKHNVKSPTLARIQRMWKQDNEDFAKTLKTMR